MRFKLNIAIALFLFSLYPVFAFAEVPQYKIKCSLNSDTREIHAEEEVVFTNNSPDNLESLYFHIYPNREISKKDIQDTLRYAGYFKINPFPEGFQKTNFVIDSITSDGQPLKFTIDGEDKSILIVCIKPLKPSQQLTLKINFKLKVPQQYGRFGYNEGIFALHRWYPLLCVYEDHQWQAHPFYLFHQPYYSDASLYDLEFTVDSQETVIHTGELVNEKNNTDGSKTLKFNTPLAVRDFSMAISKRYKVLSEEFKGIQLNSYYLEGDDFYASQALQDVKDLIDYYSQEFGPYPYKAFSIAPVYLAYGGHEASNMIFIDTRVYKLPKFLYRYFDFLVSHETGHQWFQVLVGSDEYRESWLDEGINSYFTTQYLEQKYGPNAMVMAIPKWLKWLVPDFTFKRARTLRYIDAVRMKQDYFILSKLSKLHEPSSVFAITYGKGSAVVEMLDLYVGHEVFDRIMKRYFQEFEFKNARITDFIDIAQQESGLDLGWFFDEWLKSKAYCDYAVKVQKDKVVVQRRGEIVMPVDVQIDLKDGTQVRSTLEGKEKEEAIPVKNNRQIKKAVVDPTNKLLDIDKVNNYWPRQVDVRPVAFYYPIYEIPVFLPEDKYSLIFGPYVEDGLGLKISFQKPHDYIVYASGAYDFSDYVTRSRLGFEKTSVFNSPLDFGIEGYDEETTNSAESVHGGKIYLSQQLTAYVYGLFTTTSHITYYLLRDRTVEDGSAMQNEAQSELLNYRKKDEAIAGISFQWSNEAPYPDPQRGIKLISYIESAGHFMGATQYFNRGSLDVSNYFTPLDSWTIATRCVIAGGFPKDKDLFHLGGYDGLRGYRYKSVRGAAAMLFTVENRVTLLKNLDLFAFDNIVGIEDIGAVIFFDAGKAWYNDFGAANFKKDIGFGIKLGIGIGGGMLEKGILRFDVAKALDDKEGTRFWIKFKQPF